MEISKNSDILLTNNKTAEMINDRNDFKTVFDNFLVSIRFAPNSNKGIPSAIAT